MLADFDFGDYFWTMFAFFFWFMLIWMFIAVFADILRRKDLSGGAKAGWIVRPSIVDAREMSGSAGQMQGSAGYSSPDHFA